MEQQVLREMTLYFDGDLRRVNHALKVYAFAHAIGKAEGLDADALLTLDCAALLHDIGIHEAEKQYNSTAGTYQEQLGPPIARELLLRCGADGKTIDRACFLTGHHHTLSAIDGLDFQALVEADFLVNAAEDDMDKKAVESVVRKVFRTEIGRTLAQSLYLK